MLSGSAEDKEVLQQYPLKKSYNDDKAAYFALSKLVSDLQKDGYFTVYSSISRTNSDTLFATIHVGKQFQWALLHTGNLTPIMQEESGFREKLFFEKPFYYEEIAVLFEKILILAENQGYPFATVRLANVQILGGQVHASIHYESGPLITFGKLQIKDTKHIKADFLEAYLGILPGSNYDERKIARIPDLLRALPYITLEAPLEVTFQNETADVILSLSERKSNELDGIINFFPSEGKGNKLLLTGELNVQLNNLAKSGKQFVLRWQRLQVQSQMLEISYRHPHIFLLPIDAGVDFNLYKEDTLFINRRFSMEVALPYGVGNRLFATTNWQGSRLLGAEQSTAYASEIKLANTDLLSVGVGYRRQQLNNLLFPRKGYIFSVEATIGKKRVLPDLIIGDVSQAEQIVPSWQQSLHGKLIQYHKLGSDWLLFHKFSGGYVSSQHLFAHDLYRVGGLHTLRGFYDNFFFASQYGLSNFELRLLFEQKSETYSYIFAFYDQAYLINDVSVRRYKDYPAGLGIGIHFAAPAGLFNLVYGLGKSAMQPFSIDFSKIHFGYVSRF